MDFSNPTLIISGLFIGLLGMAFFIYGKKQQSLSCLLMGVVLCVYPYFVSSTLILWLIGAGIFAAFYGWRRLSPG